MQRADPPGKYSSPLPSQPSTPTTTKPGKLTRAQSALLDVVIAAGKKGISPMHASKIVRRTGQRMDSGQAAGWMALWEHDGYLHVARRRSAHGSYLVYSHPVHHPEGPPGRFRRRGAVLKRQPVTLSGDGRDPWEQQPGEGIRHYRQFIVYRDLGLTRHVRAVAERFGITYRTAVENQRFFLWRQRAHSYDQHLARQWCAAMAAHQRNVAAEHIRLSRTVLAKVEERLAHLDPASISNSDFVRMAELYSRLMRVAVGLPDRHIALSGSVSPPTAEVPADEEADRKQTRMRAVVEELARRLAEGDEVDAEYVLDSELLGGKVPPPGRHRLDS
ncbi:hypothetical protein [Streptomyces hydrogenans]|uniref:hypothetical protein n=1 Tax=Streptomyces hydrogenans TaxID=1873719 RepID=UPI0037F45238